MVTGRAILRSVHAPGLLQMDPDEFLAPLLALVRFFQVVGPRAGFAGEVGVKSIGLQVLGLPAQVGDLIKRAECLLGIAVTIETEGHAQRFRMVDDRHLVDAPVTLHTTHPAVDVGGVIEMGVIRHLVDLHPLDGLTRVIFVILIHRLAERLELGRIGLHLAGTMAIPADLRGGNVRMSRVLHMRVAISAVHPELPGVEAVIKGNRLLRHVTDASVFRRPGIPGDGDNTGSEGAHAHQNFDRKEVCPTWKNVAHLVKKTSN